MSKRKGLMISSDRKLMALSYTMKFMLIIMLKHLNFAKSLVANIGRYTDVCDEMQ